jgi:hypothetical protein
VSSGASYGYPQIRFGALASDCRKLKYTVYLSLAFEAFFLVIVYEIVLTLGFSGHFMRGLALPFEAFFGGLDWQQFLRNCLEIGIYWPIYAGFSVVEVFLLFTLLYRVNINKTIPNCPERPSIYCLKVTRNTELTW